MLQLNGQISSDQNPNPYPRRFLRLLSMGCGMSKFDPKEVVEVKAANTSANKSASSYNCFTGTDSKSNLVEQQRPDNNGGHTTEGHRKGDEEKTKTVTMTVNVKREGGESKIEDENEKDGREICQGGSPSFREYCIDSDLESRSSMKSADCCDEDRCQWPNKRTINPEDDKGLESEMVKKERGGKGIMKALQRRKSGGMKNFLSASRRSEQQQNDSAEKLLLKSS